MFITLTVNPAWGHGPVYRARALARAWRIIRKRACRKYKYKTIPFLAVFERTKKGEPHLHIIARCKWLGQRWLSDQMKELMDAPIVDVRRVTGRRKVASYVTKYIGKDPERFGTCKRYWASTVWEEEQWEPVVSDDHWHERFEIRSMSLGALIAGWEAMGATVTTEHPWTIARWPRPPNHGGPR